MTASDVLLFRTLAAARGEGMPEPGGGLKVRYRPSGPELTVYLASAEDSLRWQEWWTRHALDEVWTHNVGPLKWHHAVAVWRGWRLDLIHLTPVELDDGSGKEHAHVACALEAGVAGE